MCKVRMSVSKETKGTFQFKEIVSGKEPAIIGTLYVPKRTLEIMGFDPAKKQVITVDLGIQESEIWEFRNPMKRPREKQIRLRLRLRKSRNLRLRL